MSMTEFAVQGSKALLESKVFYNVMFPNYFTDKIAYYKVYGCKTKFV